jgi:predicted phosphodiesterase
MTKESFCCLKPEELSEGRSIIVVSDLHLGGNEDPGTAERFCAFLDFLNEGISLGKLPRSECPSAKGDKPAKKVFYPPEKIILLGDFLELWDSRDSDRNHAMLDMFFPFLKMQNMDCDVVYVTGNHDEDMSEILSTCGIKCDPGRKDSENTASFFGIGTKKEPLPKDILEQAEKYRERYDYLPSPDPRRKGIAESIKLLWSDAGGAKQRVLEICSRHYPAHRLSGGKLGIRAGNGTYAFVHGQQFDKEQIPYTIDMTLGKRLDPVDYIQDLATISVSKQVKTEGVVALFLLFLFFIGIFGNPSLNWLRTAAGMGVGLAFTLLFGIAAVLFLERRDTLASAALLGGLCIPAALLFMGFTIAQSYDGLYLFGLAVITYVFLVIILPRALARGKRGFYNLFGTIKGPKRVDTLARKNFDPKTYQYRTGVLVFGHTHYSDFSRETRSPFVNLLVNSGAWVYDKNKQKSEYDRKDSDAFVYIDTSGICLMRWDYEASRICCLPRGTDSLKTLCEYIRDNHVDLGSPIK